MNVDEKTFEQLSSGYLETEKKDGPMKKMKLDLIAYYEQNWYLLVVSNVVSRSVASLFGRTVSHYWWVVTVHIGMFEVQVPKDLVKIC